MSLTDELNKPEYQSGSYAERFALLKSKTGAAVGRIEQGNLKTLEAMIASGLWRDKMERIKAEANATLANQDAPAPDKQLATIKLQVVAGFHEAISEAKLANKAPFEAGGHTVNMGDPMVQQTFGAAQMTGIQLITPAEAVQVMALATYQKPLWPSVNLRDVVAHFTPALVSDAWSAPQDIQAYRQIEIRLNADAPEQTYLVFQMSRDGQNWAAAGAVHGLNQAGAYIGSIPPYGGARSIRWRGEYALDVTVSGF